MTKKTEILALMAIIWVWPVRMAADARITGETERILRVRITHTAEPMIKKK